MKIAVAGKGGVGKTTLSANLAREFAARGFDVYAVDADPDVSLGAALGLSRDTLGAVHPLVELKDLVAERAGNGTWLTLNPQVDDLLESYAVDVPVDRDAAPSRSDSARPAGSIRLLRMGGVKQGGTACYCRENSFLGAVVSSVLLERNELVIMDMGAGIEHLTRGTARSVDAMVVVTEPTTVSMDTARVIGKLAQEIGIGRVFFVVNKVRNEKELARFKERFGDAEILGVVPFNEEILESSEEAGRAVAGDPAVPPMVDYLLEVKSRV